MYGSPKMREVQQMHKLLKITLKSDLCMGAGKHYAAVIDLDTALDEYGFPYIPARRLKGCLRQAAEEWFEDPALINRLFGVSAGQNGGSLRVADARPENYEQLTAARQGKAVTENARVSELFCTVRAQTAIENDTAKDGSLRFIRVVNHYSPLDDSKEQTFYADLNFDESNTQTVSEICACLRSIGYHRNRGLGAVRCELIDADDRAFAVKGEVADDNARYCLNYTVRLDSDLMLPATDGSHSLDYIPGTSVLGLLAGRYAAQQGTGLDTAAFNELFYSNDVVFSNLYISNQNGCDSFPAPRFLCKIKAATAKEDLGIKNLLHEMLLREADESENGTAKGTAKNYKPLKSGYIVSEKDCVNPAEKTVYHNAISGSGLYMQHCLCAGQFFRGRITADGKKLKVLAQLLCQSNVLNFGRSKTAQYSRCVLLNTVIEREAPQPEAPAPGSYAAILLESDVLLTDQEGVPMMGIMPLLRELNLSALYLRGETALASRTVSGYNAKWQLKKPQLCVYQAGSAVVFEVPDGYQLPKSFPYLGKKCNEGFGKLRLIPNADSYFTTEKEPIDTPDARKQATDPLKALLERAALRDRLMELAIKSAPAVQKAIGKAQIGRLTLMLKEADSFEDFLERLNSIKTQKTRDAALSLFDGKKVLAEEESWETLKEYFQIKLTVAKFLAKQQNGGNYDD